MAVKNNRRTVITRRILKESLLEFMQKKPVSKITIKEICDLADMSRSTFYLHYRDQFELLDDIEKEVLEKIFENLGSLDSKLNSIESIDELLCYVKDNKSTFGVLLCQPENRTFQLAIMDNVQQYVRSIVPSLYSDEKEAFVYSFVMQGSLSCIRDWITSDFKLPSKDLAELIYYACNEIVKAR